ncbi:MAG: hypothetical protein ACK53Y_17265, partial [bacterium]
SLYLGQVSNDVNVDASHGSNYLPMMLHLHSLNCHNWIVMCQNIQLFFNYEWSEKKVNLISDIFSTTTYPMHSPAGMLSLFLVFPCIQYVHKA